MVKIAFIGRLVVKVTFIDQLVVKIFTLINRFVVKLPLLLGCFGKITFSVSPVVN